MPCFPHSGTLWLTYLVLLSGMAGAALYQSWQWLSEQLGSPLSPLQETKASISKTLDQMVPQAVSAVQETVNSIAKAVGVSFLQPWSR